MNLKYFVFYPPGGQIIEIEINASISYKLVKTYLSFGSICTKDMTKFQIQMFLLRITVFMMLFSSN